MVVNFEREIRRRMEEFERLGKTGYTVFDFKPFLDLQIRATVKSELLFCISTANSSAKAGLMFQKLLEPYLRAESLSREKIEELMRLAGVRFSGKKAGYAETALKNFKVVEKALKMDSFNAREVLVRKIKGLGYKEASHFLRNLGRKDVSILDRHIIRWLKRNGYETPENLNRKSYLSVEEVLKEIAGERGVTLAELDLLLWSEITGMVLK